MHDTDISDVELGYIDAALWSSTHDDGEPLDVMGVEAIHPDTRKKMRAEVADFVLKNRALLMASGLQDAQIGHDFWLTRNRHGAGFWDRGLGAIGGLLTDACRDFGEVDLYVGDDGKIHQ
jgi:hypothetical protein